MVMDAAELGTVAGAMQTDARNEWTRLGMLQRHIDGKLISTWMPPSADLEYRDLFKKASTPWLGFVRDAIAQGCRVSGYTREDVWDKVWRANGMDGRQGVVTREAVGLGRSFMLLLPSTTPGDVTVRPMSAHNAFAIYDDPWDEYPAQVLYRIGKRRRSFWESEWYLIDREAAYRFSGTPGSPQNLRVKEHGQGFTPVVQISNELTVDSDPRSSVAGAIPVYKRIVDATFTLQMLQRYGAFPQKYMAGGTLGDVRPAVDSLIHAEGEGGEDTRFGTFAAADVEKMVVALDAHIKHLSAVCQVPPHYLLGAVVNMSAEGIAAAESGYHRNVSDRKSALAEGYELVMRTGAAMIGDTEAANDTAAHVDWENLSSWSLGQIADAVTKLGAQGVELARLLRMIPGWTNADAATAAEGAEARLAARGSQGQELLGPRELAELVQKLYLGVDRKAILTSGEAREIANRAGAGLIGDLPEVSPA